MPPILCLVRLCFFVALRAGRAQGLRRSASEDRLSCTTALILLAMAELEKEKNMFRRRVLATSVGEG